MLLTGIAHVHSTYSWDGCHPLAQLVADLHRIESDPAITLQVDCLDRSAPPIIEALASGAYRVAGASLTFSPDAPPDLSSPPLVFRVARSLTHVKRRAQRLDKWLNGRGVQFPAPLYRAARRLFR